jgi:tRNA-splicing ligase RtcB
MKTVVSTEKVPIKMWLDNIETGAMTQAMNLANLPMAFQHIAIMPDSHQGYGMPIGAVMASRDYVFPNAVGVDIGCGMCAMKTSITDAVSTEDLKRIMGGSQEYKGGIRSSIPVGYNHKSKKCPEDWMPYHEHINSLKIVQQEYGSAQKQLGTLGGGNHFIEIQRGSDEHLWIMVHSGSRNLGFTVAHHYIKLAKQLNAKWHSIVPASHDLAYLPIDSKEGQLYLQEMQYCVDFALENRYVMLDRIKEAILEVFPDTTFELPINKAHNDAQMENHFGKNVMVHRKGATRAYEGEMGIIPGSQGSCSYIVSGKGNPESFKSCSHGAGRTMSRTRARLDLNFQKEVKHLEKLGIMHTIRSAKQLDEATGSYKDIELVMAQQADLVNIAVQLFPLACIKG